MKDQWGGFIFFAVVLLAAWLFSESVAYNELTIYVAFCEGKRVPPGKCVGKQQAANWTTYKVFPDLQTVVYWTGDGGQVKRLKNCAVRNAKNWSCELSEKRETSYEWQMREGEFLESGDLAPVMMKMSDLFYQVPKWRWWLIKVRQI